MTTTAYLENDEEVCVTGTVVWGNEATFNRYGDDPPEHTHVEDLCVELDGEDVTDALTARERDRCEDALIEAARAEPEGPDPDRGWDERMAWTREEYFR